MYRDNKIDPKRQSEFQKMQHELSSLKNELIKFQKKYEDTISNIDIENISINLMHEIIKNIKTELGFIDSSGNQQFKIKNDSNYGICIYLADIMLGYVSSNGTFIATGTWNFSNANKIE